MPTPDPNDIRAYQHHQGWFQVISGTVIRWRLRHHVDPTHTYTTPSFRDPDLPRYSARITNGDRTLTLVAADWTNTPDARIEARVLAFLRDPARSTP